MRKTLIAMIAAAALSACAAPAVTPVTASGGSSISGFATLANFGTWEMDLAPAYTRLAVVRHRAARELDAGRIGVATAIDIQASADKARALLDASRRGNLKTPTAQQRDTLDQALHQISAVEQLLEK